VQNDIDPFELLFELNAPDHLISHLRMVQLTAIEVTSKLTEYGLPIDLEFVSQGAALHDTGKIQHPEELSAPGNRHEAAGEALLVNRGLPSSLARVCVSHSRWMSMDCSLEELIIALADNLWKGKRNPDLVLLIIEACSKLMPKPYWQVNCDLDSIFETIADGGTERLLRA
jgi:hypothetical protein